MTILANSNQFGTTLMTVTADNGVSSAGHVLYADG